MSEPRIPPPTEEDLSRDLEADWAGLQSLAESGHAVSFFALLVAEASVRRLAAAEARVRELEARLAEVSHWLDHHHACLDMRGCAICCMPWTSRT